MAKQKDQFDRFISRIEEGRYFELACHEAKADPQTIVDRVKRDPDFKLRVNMAKRLSFQKSACGFV